MKRPEEYLLQTLPQICTASAQANIKHVPKLMQYRFAVIYETLSSIFTAKSTDLKNVKLNMPRL